MMTAELMESNKQEFLALLNKINREGFDKEGLLRQLTKSDFFEAPATTRHAFACPGGLCAHSLDVYYSLLNIVQMSYNASAHLPYTEETIVLVGLFSALSRMNKYEATYRNVKRYHEGGSRRDEVGAFDWEMVQEYAVKDPESRLIYGDEGVNTVYMLGTYVPLTLEEQVALMHCGIADVDNHKDTMHVFRKYPLAVFLKMAVEHATFFGDPVWEQSIESNY